MMIRRSFDFDSFGRHDRAEDPGYVHDDIWCLVNIEPAVETLRRHIGGDGRGDGDALLLVLLQQAYVASNVDEFRRPPKLRERLTEIKGPVTSV